MVIEVITAFPGMFSVLNESIVGRAVKEGHVKLRTWDLRDFSNDKHRCIDDYPYGGGPGMVMRAEPFFRAVAHLRSIDSSQSRVILLCPQGERLTQSKAHQLAEKERLILLCGHYEGVDERVRENLVDEEISLGDFILTGGEIPAIALTDAVVRLLPGVLPPQSVKEESFTDGLLEYPQYTRPAEYSGLQVPEVLLSGNHGLIKDWRREKALLNTLLRRPEMLCQAVLTDEEKDMLEKEARNRGIQTEL